MLKELQVKNFAIIDDVKINFKKGFNVLTGETGAGKTLIIEAINLLIGERADISLIRKDKEKLFVQGFFDFSENYSAADFLIKENLIDKNDPKDDIVITREVNKKGKSRAFINGVFTQAGTLKKLGEYFIDIHGQHDHQYLLKPDRHIEVIDRLGRDEIEKTKKEYIKVLKNFYEEKEKIINLLKLQEEREEKLIDLKYKLDEIEKLNITEDEEESLENEKRILKNFEKIYELSQECINIIKGSHAEKASLSNYIALLEVNLKKLADIDYKFKKFSDDFSTLSIFIEEFSHYLNSYIANFDFSPKRLDYIQERLYKLSEIKKKYNMDLASIKKYTGKIVHEIEMLEGIDYELEKKKKDFSELEKLLVEKALKLTSARKSIIDNLEREVIGELLELNFKTVNFKIKNDYIKGNDGAELEGKNIKFTKDGIDDIEFLISLNPGENIKPLRKIASCGEISRIMLALKTIIGSADNISIMIFDEIDVGIGGETSRKVGEKLYKISTNCQVICITHLAQIGCFSDSHYFIDKYVEGGNTKIKIKKLDDNNKIIDISRMLSGEKESEISIIHAEKLLEQASKIKGRITGGNYIGN